MSDIVKVLRDLCDNNYNDNFEKVLNDLLDYYDHDNTGVVKALDSINESISLKGLDAMETAIEEIQKLRAENERLRNKKSAAVCEWGVTSSGWYQGSCNENCKWLFRGHEECPSCGKPIEFAEAKE